MAELCGKQPLVFFGFFNSVLLRNGSQIQIASHTSQELRSVQASRCDTHGQASAHLFSDTCRLYSRVSESNGHVNSENVEQRFVHCATGLEV